MTAGKATKNRLRNSWEAKCEEAAAAAEQGNDEKAAELYDRAADYADELGRYARDEAEANEWLSTADKVRQKAAQLRGDGPPPTTEQNDRATETDTRQDDGSESTAFDAPEPDDDAPIGDTFQEPPEGGFDNIVGHETLIETVEDEVLLPLNKPAHFERLGVGIEQSLLLTGPPGNGKTYFAKQLAAETGYPIAIVTPSEVMSRWVGEAAKRIATLYENAIANAEHHGGAIVLLDEIDALAPDRENGRSVTNSEYQMLTELLTQLQELNETDANVVTVGTTNVEGELDGALTRTERFNKEFSVDPPDEQTRIDLLEHYLTRIPEDGNDIWPVPYFGRSEFIAQTDEYVASDIKAVATIACRLAAAESTRRGTAVDPQWTHVNQAIEEVGDGTLASWDTEDSGAQQTQARVTSDVLGD